MFSRIKRIYKEYKELKYLAYHDSLTGLFNRNWLYKNINKINTKYVYFIDINDLKEINKNGHIFGDNYIKNVVSNITHKGILIRYGDEFILFSNYENEIKSNIQYAVGFSIISNNTILSIEKADLDMIKNKNLFKLRESFP